MAEKFYTGGFFYDARTRSVLLHLRDGNTRFSPNLWSVFGGVGEESETPAECFMREIAEELGITLAPSEVVPLRDEQSSDFHRYAFYVQKAVPVSEIRLTEGAGFGWIPLEKVFAHDLADNVRGDLELFMKTHSL